jgi:hypothetical protein
VKNGYKPNARSLNSFIFYGSLVFVFVLIGWGPLSCKSIFPVRTEDHPRPKPITWMHWQACTNSCKGRTPQSVERELYTPFILCECMNGKLYRLSKIIEDKKI